MERKFNVRFVVLPDGKPIVELDDIGGVWAFYSPEQLRSLAAKLLLFAEQAEKGNFNKDIFEDTY